MKYKVSIETLSPLHIGTGTELLKDFDYVSVKETTYVINQDAVYGIELDSRGGEARLSVPPGRLVSADQWRENSPLVRYTLQGSTTIERVHEQIKDVHGRCYLPGSSFKGALRTGLLSYAMLDGMLNQVKVNYEEGKRGYVKESAAKNFERAFFRPKSDDANHDVLRALHVADSSPLPASPSKLILCPVRVFTGGLPGSPIVVEALQKGAIFDAEISIDELTLQYADRLGWENRGVWLANVISILQQVSRRRIQQELQAAREKGFATAEKFYLQLEQFAQKLTGTQSAVLQMGWGTGWNGMTMGPWLPKPAQNEAREKFQLGRPPGQRGSWEPDLNKPYPKSRRLRANNEIPGVPLGWIALTLEPTGQPSKLWQSLSKPITITDSAQDTSHTTPSDPTEYAASHSENRAQPSPSQPRAVKSAPLQPQTALIRNFKALPKPGDLFEGTVFNAEGNEVQLEIPGLDPDMLGYAVLLRSENPLLGKTPEGRTILCQVKLVKEESKGYWRVECRLA